MKKFEAYLAGLVVVITALTLCGWQFDIELLKRPLPRMIAMNPMTAVSLLALALSVLCLVNAEGRKGFLLATRSFALFSIVIGVTRLMAFTGIHDFGIDVLLFKQAIDAEAARNILNTMAANTAFSFIVFGIVIFISATENGRLKMIGNYFLVVVFIIGLMAIISHLYGVRERNGILWYLTMAPQTGFCFVLLALAVLFNNRDFGFMYNLSSPNAGGKMSRFLIPSAIFIPVLIGFIRVYVHLKTPTSEELGISLLITSIIITLLILITYVSWHLNETDVARTIAEEQLKHTIEELQTTEERLQLANEGTAAGIWDWMDVNSSDRWWSPQYFKMLGYENNEIKPTSQILAEQIHPEDADRAAHILLENTSKSRRFEMEVRYKTKNGQYKWFQVTGQGRLDKNGKLRRLAGSMIDIDEKKRALDVIKNQAMLIQMVPDGIVFSTKDRIFYDLNAGAEKMLDLKREEVVGKLSDNYISINLPRNVKFREAEKELWKNGFWRGEVEITNLITGKKVYVLTSLKTIENMIGDVPGFMAIFTDLSPLRINEELKIALAKLERNNEYLEQLAYISAHDIKAPIITLQGLTEMLRQQVPGTQGYNDMLDMLKSTVHHMQLTNNSLNHILKLQRNLQSRRELQDEVFSFKTMLDEVRSLLQHNIDMAKASVEFEVKGFEKVKFHYVHLKSIVYNLLNNAIKYRDEAKPLAIKITAVRINEKSLSLEIQDNGLGMDLDQNRGKLFGIFKRFHDHVEGSGVGLHIIKSIVDAYGGSVSVKSKLGEGTTFSIVFESIIVE